MDFEIGMSGLWWGPLRHAALDLAALDRQPLHCPRCGSRDCAAGVLASWLDRFLLEKGRVPYECRYCGRRFRHFDPARADRMSGVG